MAISNEFLNKDEKYSFTIMQSKQCILPVSNLMQLQQPLELSTGKLVQTEGNVFLH
jgi:hypothetical protein